MVPRKFNNLSIAVAALFALGTLAACSGGGSSSGGGGGSGVTVTTVAGKVTVTESSKPNLKARAKARAQTAARSKALNIAKAKGKPGGKIAQIAAKPATSGISVPGLQAVTVVSGASVFLYDSDHPEYLAPVAWTTTDSSGDYLLDVLAYATENTPSGGTAPYTNGVGIPVGNYTLLAYKPSVFDPVTGITSEAIVAIQTIVEDFSGTITGSDLSGQDSTVTLKVMTMFGQDKNRDGTQTWGSTGIELAPNAAIQVTFSMAISRGSADNITIVDGSSASPTGSWAVSADWLSATFYLDDGETLTTNTTYTVTVPTTVTNVYGNGISVAAVGTFSVAAAAVVDTTAPTVTISSPTAATGVAIVTPIRVESNEVLDINGLLLSSTPTLGAKPGVMFIGEDSGVYTYEFVLADPLTMETTYDITVSGGEDLAGNAMTTATHSFTTETAAASAGITDGASPAMQNAQAAVKDAFGKWVRAMNDRNLAALQNMMTGGFVFEYDTSIDGAWSEDVDRNGRLDLEEFGNMVEAGFLNWEACDTTITGTVLTIDPKTGEAININVVSDVADIVFTLDFVSADKSQKCNEGGPDSFLFMTLNNKNEAWLIARVSEGIDTRDRTLVAHEVIGLITPVDGTVLAGTPSIVVDGSGNPIVDSDGIMTWTDPVTFEWNETEGVTTYIAVFMNRNKPEDGVALAIPSGTTTIVAPPTIDMGTGDLQWPQGVVDVSRMFGLNPDRGAGIDRDGEQFQWEIIGLGSITARDLEGDRGGDLFADIVAMSRLNTYSNPGTRMVLDVAVTDTGGTAITFDEMIWGYDAVDASQVILNITTNSGSSAGFVNVSGNSFFTDTLAFSSGVATVTIDLSVGWNWVEVCDSAASASWGGCETLMQNFNVLTTGGILPVVSFTSIVDQDGTDLPKDSWGFYNGEWEASPISGVTSVTISGDINEGLVTNMWVNVWSDEGASYNAQVDLSGVTTFSVTVDVFAGNNWISFTGDDGDGTTTCWDNYTLQCFYADVGVYTDTGTTWVAPITVDAVTALDDTDTDVSLQTEDYGNSSNWEASGDADDVVTITGRVEYASDSEDPNNLPMYDVWSEGAWTTGELTVAADGSFSLDVTLYMGWNYVSLMDVKGNWYGVNIFTDTSSNVIVRPAIDTLNSVAWAPANEWDPYTSDSCTVTIEGTAIPGELHVYWNGSTGGGSASGNWYWDEEIVTVTDDGNNLGTFSVTMNLVSGTDAYNWIDVADANWNWIGLNVIVDEQAAGSCTPPAMPTNLTVNTPTDTSGGALSINQYGDVDAGQETAITISGTSDILTGQGIDVYVDACGAKTAYNTTADGSGDWTVNVNVSDGWNSIDITDGINWQWLGVEAQNGVVTTPILEAGVDGLQAIYAGCGWSEWDAGSASSATISGTTTAGDGTGIYWIGATEGTFTITSGAFSFPVDLFSGRNDIGIGDANWNWHQMSITTTGGAAPLAFVTITSPTNAETVSAGTVTVTGNINPYADQGATVAFVPVNVYAWAADWIDGTWIEYSANPEDASWGALLLIINQETGDFSFDIPVTSNTTEITVEAQDANWIYHGHTITVNATGMAAMEYIWKPGTATSGKKSRSDAMKERISKSRQKFGNGPRR